MDTASQGSGQGINPKGGSTPALPCALSLDGSEKQLSRKQTPRRRRNGEGSVTRRKDGRWQLAYVAGKKPDGKPRRVYEYFTDEVEAHKRKTEVAYLINSGRLSVQEHVTFEELGRAWLKTKKPMVKRNTITSYQGLLEGHIFPSIGSMKATAIKPSTVEALQSSLLSKGLSASTTITAMWLVSAVLDVAVRDDLLRKNPAADVRRPKRKRAQSSQAYDSKEAARFLHAARAERLYPLLYLVIALGLRRGEVLGLRWQDVDLEEQHLDVKVTLQRDPKAGFVLESPKTENSQRRLYFHQDVASVLNEHMKRQATERHIAAEAWQENGLVFTTAVGTPIDPDNLKRVVARVAKAADVRRIRFHDLRHTYASLALLNRVDDKVLSERLGHSDVSFTRRTYQHTFEEQHKATALSVSQLLGIPELPPASPPN